MNTASSPPDDAARRWSELDAALDALIDLPPAQRLSAARRLANGRPDLQDRLVVLCEALEGEDPLLDRPAAALLTGAAPPREAPGPQVRLGAWRLGTLIGRGGMGEVYRVHRDDGAYRQDAALKLMRAGLADDARRFERERQMLASLDHPGIARLLDGGVAADGRPYMVLELVEGRTITSWCEANEAGLDRRLALFLEVCEAVAYAHRHLVVHLDIKPANVFVNAEGQVKLLDFGIARLLQSPGAAAENTLRPALTPGYAAPEQWNGEPVSTAADVYALGILLHELLVGEPPWPTDGVPLAVAIERTVHGTLPVASRQALAMAHPGVPPNRLRGDLDAILAKATRRDPAARYDGVAALIADLGRHLAHEPVLAREGARLYPFGRLLRRHRALAAGLAVSALLLATGVGAVAWQAHRADIEARKAQAERDFLVDIFRQNAEDHPDGAKAGQVTAEQLLRRAAERVPTALAGQREVRAEMEDTLFELFDQLQDYAHMVAFERARLDEIHRTDGARPSRERAQVEFGLGRSQLMAGDVAAARGTLDQAAATLDALGDRGSSLRADVLMHQARVAYRQATPKDDTAARLAERAQALYPTDNMNWIYAGQLRARVLQSHGDFDAANRAFQELVDAARRPPFDRDPVTAAYLEMDLGASLLDQARFSRAGPLLADALARMTHAYGPDRPHALQARFYYGVYQLAHGEVAAGAAAMRGSVAGFERTLGPDHVIWTLPMRVRLARAALQRGDLAGAGALSESTVARYDARAPNDRNGLPSALLMLARVQLLRGNDAAARQAIERADRLLPRDEHDHSHGAGGRRLVQALLQARTGEAGAARRQLEQIRADWAWTPELLREPGVAATLALAELDIAQGHPEAARPRLQVLLARLQADPDRESLADWRAQAQMLLGEAALAGADAAAAAPALESALALRETYDVPGSFWVARLRADLARARGLPPGVHAAGMPGASAPAARPG